MTTVRYQSTSYRRIMWPFSALIALLQLSMLVQPIGDQGPHRDAAIAFAATASVGMLLLLGRFVRVAVYAEEKQLRIVNPLRTYVMPWSELASVEFGHRCGRVVTVAIRRDGRRIPLVALAVPLWHEAAPERSDAGTQLRALSQLLARCHARQHDPHVQSAAPTSE